MILETGIIKVHQKIRQIKVSDTLTNKYTNSVKYFDSEKYRKIK